MRLPKSDDNNQINGLSTTQNSNHSVSTLVDYNETKGRKYLKQISKTIFPTLKRLSFSDNKFARWDSAVQTEDESKYMIEIKCRNMDSTRYKDYMVEEKKLQFLIEKAAEGYIPLYINFFDDGKCLVWDLRYELGTEIVTMTANKMTVCSTTNKVAKVSRLLLANRATVYDYVIDVAKPCSNISEEDLI